MNDKRRLILFTITLLIWLLVVQFYLKKRHEKDKQPPPPTSVTEQAEEERQTVPSEDKIITDTTQDQAFQPEHTDERPPSFEPGPPAVEEMIQKESFVLETSPEQDKGYHLTFTNQGASILSLKLKSFYRDKAKKEEKLELLSAEETGLRAFQLSGFSLRRGESLEPEPLPELNLDKKIWKTIEKGGRRAVFETAVIPGIIIRKEIIFNEAKNGFDIILSQTNKTGIKVKTSFDLLASSGVIPEYPKQKPNPLKGVMGIKKESGAGKVYTYPIRKLDKEPVIINETGDLAWIAGCNKYFAVLLKHETNVNCDPILLGKVSKILQKPNGDAEKKSRNTNIASYVKIINLDTEPGQTSSISFTLYAIPIRKDDLQRAGVTNYREIIAPGNFTHGFIDTLGELFLVILKGLHAVFPNWGIAIILLTCIVNAALYHLTKKGQISMHRMQELQPLMKEIRKKYKNNKQKMNEETMKLYHKHGVNPVGGCLPMLIQLPIFIGLLFGLRSSFNLRQSEFLWINDLSLPDALFSLPFNFVSSLNVLPILMAVTMLIQQKFTSPKKPGKTSGEPDTQKQMEGAMKIMPWFMLFIFYTMPAGLNLYFVTGSILRIFETYHIKKNIIPKLEQKNAPSKKQQKKTKKS